MLEQGRRVAATDAVVLIRGESGTGKGVLARAIHAWSRRARAPFVTVSCPSLSAELLESDLFGHVRGAFTGAVARHRGQGRRGRGGHPVPRRDRRPAAAAPAQAAPLPPGAAVRAGRRGPAPVGRRPAVAATNRDLEAAVAAGQFREDLLYRLNVVELTLPPLRERSDRLALAEHLLAFFARQMGKRIEGFTAEAREALLRYPWPGNLRELRNAIERAAIFATGPVLDAGDLPGRVTAGAVPTGRRQAAPPIERRRAGDPRTARGRAHPPDPRRHPQPRGRRADPGHRPEHPLPQAQAARTLNPAIAGDLLRTRPSSSRSSNVRTGQQKL